MIRPEVRALIELGPFPPSETVDLRLIERQQALLNRIAAPVTDDEAKELIKLFGPDDYFGGAWTVLHLVESAPGWPLWDSLSNDSNDWILRLKQRAQRGAARNQSR